jgi:hypothetical protein
MIRFIQNSQRKYFKNLSPPKSFGECRKYPDQWAKADICPGSKRRHQRLMKLIQNPKRFKKKHYSEQIFIGNNKIIRKKNVNTLNYDELTFISAKE